MRFAANRRRDPSKPPTTCRSRTSSRCTPCIILQRPVGATLGEALAHLLDQALSHPYPKHPKFGQEIKVGKD